MSVPAGLRNPICLPAKRTRGITPLRLPPAGYLDELGDKNGLKDQKFINVGYGGDVPATEQPIVTYDGVRKSSVSTYMALEANWLWLHMTAATGNGGDCYGDSGGPKLLAPPRTTASIRRPRGRSSARTFHCLEQPESGGAATCARRRRTLHASV